MLDIHEVDRTIRELENGDTTFATCSKLADLYIVRKYFETSKEMQEEYGHKYGNPQVKKELSDILPSYTEYCDLKKHYQMGEITEKPVLSSLEKMCDEIMEFMQALYSSTDMSEERMMITGLIEELQNTIK